MRGPEIGGIIMSLGDEGIEVKKWVHVIKEQKAETL